MNPDPSYLIYIEILVSVILMVLSGLMAAAQRALADINKNHIKLLAEDGDKKAKDLLSLYDKSYKLLAASIIMLGFTAIFITKMIAVNHYTFYSDILSEYKIFAAKEIAILLVSMVSALVFLTLAIFVPRQIARQHAEGVGLALSNYARFMIIILTPFILITSAFTNLILKLTRQKTGLYEESFSEENVISMLEIGQESGALKEEGKKMINSIFAFDDKLAYEIMTPRTDVFSIDIKDNQEEYIDELMEMRYSRIPVYEDDSDNIIGILNIKDYLIKAREDGFENVDIKEILRDPFFIPETKNIDSLFFDLQKQKQHIAILIDEYGGFSGIVTMEDIIEEVMGDIDDEFDEEEHEIEEVGPNKYLIDGYMNLNDINEELHTTLSSETSETVGGLIIDILGEIPNDNPSEKITVSYENYDFEVVSVKDRRIERIIMTIKPKDDIHDEEEKEDKREK